jgi:beta-glucanase (GH16 family)
MKLNFNPSFRLVILSCIFLDILGCSLYSQTYDLVWSDEFDYTGLPDTTKWNYDVGGHGWGNQELQYYTYRRLENVRVEEGKLVIEAKKESYEGKNYTSARLVTKNQGDWLYGKIEVSARLPKGRGTWPAIWMLPTDWEYGDWPSSGEIDIMEHVGYDEGVVHGTVHTEAFNHSLGTQKGNSVNLPDATTAFHEYAIEWTHSEIYFFIDGTKYFTFIKYDNDYKKWPFDKRFHLVMNIAVGGSWGGAQGVDDNAFPTTMEIDYVRVYQLASTTAIDVYDKKISNPDNSDREFVISPNPFVDHIKINYSGSIDRIEIYNSIGQKIMNAEYSLPDPGSLIVLNLEYLERGIYFLGFVYQNDLRGIMKAIKFN